MRQLLAVLCLAVATSGGILPKIPEWLTDMEKGKLPELTADQQVHLFGQKIKMKNSNETAPNTWWQSAEEGYALPPLDDFQKMYLFGDQIRITLKSSDGGDSDSDKGYPGSDPVVDYPVDENETSNENENSEGGNPTAGSNENQSADYPNNNEPPNYPSNFQPNPSSGFSSPANYPSSGFSSNNNPSDYTPSGGSPLDLLIKNNPYPTSGYHKKRSLENFIETRTLEIYLPYFDKKFTFNIGDLFKGRQEVEGRSPMKKILIPVLLALTIISAILLPALLTIIKMIAVKGLTSGVVSLIISKLLGVKALLNHHHHHAEDNHRPYFVYLPHGKHRRGEEDNLQGQRQPYGQWGQDEHDWDHWKRNSAKTKI